MLSATLFALCRTPEVMHNVGYHMIGAKEEPKRETWTDHDDLTLLALRGAPEVMHNVGDHVIRCKVRTQARNMDKP